MVVPLVYLGLPVEENYKKEDTWNPVLEKLKKKLCSWSHKYISFSGRVSLIN